MSCLFGGCVSDWLDTQGMMTPPKANADQQEIHQLLQGTSASLTFVYPSNGEYRSAIIMRDLTGDGKEDAIGFIKLDAGVEVQFMVKQDGAWRSVGRFRNAAAEVDRVCFGDVDGDGLSDVLIGWGNTQSVAATLTAYTYNGTRFTDTSFEEKYEAMVLTDFDHDNVMEVFIMQRPVLAQDETTETIPARAEYFSIQNGDVVSLGYTEADDSITKFSSTVFGNITNKLSGVVTDGLKSDGSMTTQVFFLDTDGQLRSVPAYPNDPEAVSPFYRPSGPTFTAIDIDKDGIIEVPVATQMPVLSDEVLDSTSFLVEWSRARPYDDPQYRRILSGFMNLTENYWFRTPKWLEREITATNDKKLRTVIYYKVEQSEGENGEEEQWMGPRLFGIRVFSRAAWEERAKLGGYEPLIEEDEQIYALITYTKDEKYLLAIEKVKETFSLISG